MVRISFGGLPLHRNTQEDAYPKPVAVGAMSSPGTVFYRLEKSRASIVSKCQGQEIQNAKPKDQMNPKPLILKTSFLISLSRSSIPITH